MGPTPVYGARAEKPLKNADFAMKQTNICRLSGDITRLYVWVQLYTVDDGRVTLSVIITRHCPAVRAKQRYRPISQTAVTNSH